MRHGAVQWLAAELTLTSDGLTPDMAVAIDADGFVREICPVAEVDEDERVRQLHRQVLLPGFINAHSHAFQRAMRGATEYRVAGRDDDFWSWRERMYATAERLGPHDVYRVALQLYEEMVAAGYTTVGEFHYLHHKSDGTAWPDPAEMGAQLIRAAEDAGIRLVLLPVLYMAGGFGKAIEPRQKRFASADLDTYLALVEQMESHVRDTGLATVGLAPHSLRAVPQDVLVELAKWNETRRMPLHIHLAEQPAEVAQCREVLGTTPVQALADTGLLTQGTVLVHATHIEPDDPATLADADAAVCLCPTTEANLGDGIAPAARLLAAGVSLSIGSDSHICVNPFEELRWIEYSQRLRHQRRNVLAESVAADQDGRQSATLALVAMGSRNGADALGLAAGQIEVGSLADFVALDLDDPALRDVELEHVADAIVFSAGPRAVTETIVAGRTIFSQRRV